MYYGDLTPWENQSPGFGKKQRQKVEIYNSNWLRHICVGIKERTDQRKDLNDKKMNCTNPD